MYSFVQVQTSLKVMEMCCDLLQTFRKMLPSSQLNPERRLARPKQKPVVSMRLLPHTSGRECSTVVPVSVPSERLPYVLWFWFKLIIFFAAPPLR